MTVLLDACVVCRAQDAGCLAAFLDAARLADCSFATEVYFELTGRPGARASGEQLAAKAEIDARGFRVEDISLGSVAESTYRSLRRGRNTPSNAGECHSIALASADRALRFAKVETKAGWLAVNELAERAWALPFLLRYLVDRGGLAESIADAVLGVASVESGAHRPTWWPRAGSPWSGGV